MLVDVDWVLRVFMTDVRLLINGLLKVATLTHIWVDFLWAPRAIQCYPRRSRGIHVIILWFATQAQWDHYVIHARNFRVQPQAIMGSGIVD